MGSLIQSLILLWGEAKGEGSSISYRSRHHLNLILGRVHCSAPQELRIKCQVTEKGYASINFTRWSSKVIGPEDQSIQELGGETVDLTR